MSLRYVVKHIVKQKRNTAIKYLNNLYREKDGNVRQQIGTASNQMRVSLPATANPLQGRVLVSTAVARTELRSLLSFGS